MESADADVDAPGHRLDSVRRRRLAATLLVALVTAVGLGVSVNALRADPATPAANLVDPTPTVLETVRRIADVGVREPVPTPGEWVVTNSSAWDRLNGDYTGTHEMVTVVQLRGKFACIRCGGLPQKGRTTQVAILVIVLDKRNHPVGLTYVQRPYDLTTLGDAHQFMLS